MDKKNFWVHIFILTIISLAPFIGIIGCGGINCDRGCVCVGDNNSKCGILSRDNDYNDISMNSCFCSGKESTCLGCGKEIKSSSSISSYCHNCTDLGDCINALSCVKDSEDVDNEDAIKVREENYEIQEARGKVVSSILSGACGFGCQNGCFEQKSDCVTCLDCATGCSTASLNGCTFGCVGGCPKLRCGEDVIYKKLD